MRIIEHPIFVGRKQFVVRFDERVTIRRRWHLVDPFAHCCERLIQRDPLQFVDSKPYSQRLKSMEQATGLTDALISARGAIDGEQKKAAD